MAKTASTLPSDRTFVVQFRSGKKIVRSRGEKRSGLMVLGQTAFFAVGKHLWKFVEHLFISFRDKPPW